MTCLESSPELVRNEGRITLDCCWPVVALICAELCAYRSSGRDAKETGGADVFCNALILSIAARPWMIKTQNPQPIIQKTRVEILQSTASIQAKTRAKKCSVL